MLWVKSFHLIFMVCWFAALFYLPRLFVYHARAIDEISRARFEVMEHKLFWYIMTPAAVLTIIFGLWLWGLINIIGQWFIWKIILVLGLIAFHIWCWFCMRALATHTSRRSQIYFRWMNEVPTLLLFAIIILTVVKPF